MRSLNIASSASEASGRSESTAPISSSQLLGRLAFALERLPDLAQEQLRESARDRVAVAAHALDQLERRAQRDAERHHLLGRRQQRRARDFEAVLAERHQHAQAPDPLEILRLGRAEALLEFLARHDLGRLGIERAR